MAKKKPARRPTVAQVAHIAEDLRGLAVSIDAIRPDPQNARTHDEANLKSIEASLREFGQVKPLVVDAACDEIVAGNGTHAAALSLGWEYVACVRRQFTAAERRGYAIADNRTAELADWDQTILDELIGQIEEDDPDLAADLLLAELATDPEPDDEEPKSPPQPPSAAYQIIIECADDKSRQALIGKLRSDGVKCHAVTWTE